MCNVNWEIDIKYEGSRSEKRERRYKLALASNERDTQIRTVKHRQLWQKHRYSLWNSIRRTCFLRVVYILSGDGLWLVSDLRDFFGVFMKKGKLTIWTEHYHLNNKRNRLYFKKLILGRWSFDQLSVFSRSCPRPRPHPPVQPRHNQMHPN